MVLTIYNNVNELQKEIDITLDELILLRVGYIASIHYPFKKRQKYLNKLFSDKFWRIIKR